MGEHTAISRNNSWRLVRGVGLLAVMFAVSLYAVSVAQGSAICAPGSGASDCIEPYGVAVDFETERTYVVDRERDRVNVYNSDDSFAFSFNGSGGGNPRFSGPSRIAVDNDPSSPARHDIYVYDSGELERFHSNGDFVTSRGGFADSRDLIATGPGGAVYLSEPNGEQEETELVRLDYDLDLTGTCHLYADILNAGLAVGPSGKLFAAFNKSNRTIREFEWSEPSCIETNHFEDLGTENRALAVDRSGRLIAAGKVGVAVSDQSLVVPIVTVFQSELDVERRFGYGEVPVESGTSIASGVAAVDPIGKGAVLSFDGRFPLGEVPIVTRAVPPPTGPLVPPRSIQAPAAEIASTKATLRAEVMPQGEGASYRFDYLSRASFEAQGNSFVGPRTATNEGTISSTDFQLHPVEALVGCPNPAAETMEPGNNCLEPETEYVYRVVAENPSGQGNTPLESTAFAFTTKAAPEIKQAFASAVGNDSARFGVMVNPLGIPTSGHFEYVTEAAYEANLTAGGDGFAAARQSPDVESGENPLDFGFGEAPVSREITVYPLRPGTTYRYRLSATNAISADLRYSAVGSIRTLALTESEPCPGNTAFRTGSSSVLPDCRAYELVSPVDKQGGDIIVRDEITTVAPAVLNQSSQSGEKIAYGSYRAFGDAKAAGFTAQYLATREAGVRWSSAGISPPRGGAVVEPPGQLDTEVKLLSPDLCEMWIQTYAEPVLAPGGVAGTGNLYHQGLCPATSYDALTTVRPKNAGPDEFTQKLELQGVSADGRVSIYSAPDNLGSGVPAQPDACKPSGIRTCQRRLYEHVRGELAPKFACVLPGGASSSEPCTAGSVLGDEAAKYRRASLHNAISADGQRVFWSEQSGFRGRIYVRSAGKSRNVSKAAEDDLGPSAQRTAWFWGASDNGDRALFTLTIVTGGVLYVFDTESEEAEPIAERVTGVLGASESLDRIYFVSREALADGAIDGEPNVFLYEEDGGGGSFRFLATISEDDAREDVPGMENTSPVARVAFQHTSRVTPDGTHVAFVAHTSPTGYDNTDADSPTNCGEAGGICNAEVFVYDSTADGGAGKLFCASCNPSGGRPAGGSQLPPFENALYEGPRSLAADGSRVFFESEDSVVARDRNDRLDVYQWERLGAGACDADDSSFSAGAGGCVDLISSGQGSRDSRFVDASPDGDDVFFTTLSSLLPQDSGLVDIYDARAGGGLPSPAPVPAACEGEACQSPPSSPQDQTPASETFRGPGNFAPKRHLCLRVRTKKRKTSHKRARAAHKRAKASGKKVKAPAKERKASNKNRHCRRGKQRGNK